MARTDRAPRRRLGVDARQNDILAAAEAAFRDTTYADVKVSAVAEAAGASAALVYRYYSTKAGLYAAVVAAELDDLATRQAEALSAVPDGSPVRDRVRALLEATLDHVAGDPLRWAAEFAGDEPAEAVTLRTQDRIREVAALRDVLLLSDWARDEFSVTGYFGFVDAACRAWAADGCPEDRRWAVRDSALGALQGAIGDWRG